MKHILSFVLVLLMAVGCLTACGKKDTQDTTVPSTTEDTTEATTVPPETTEQTEPEAKFRHPLTGEPVEESYGQRPMAVTINNIKACLPQFGIADADMLYEVETEGGITRCLAIFTDVSKTGSVGPVRSTRSYFNNVALSYQAPLVHCGGSKAGLAGLYGESGKIQNWEHVDGRMAGQYFFRDKDRYNNHGYAWEHTLFTTGEKLTKLMDDKGYNKEKAPESYGLQFDDGVKLSGSAAKTVKVNFDGNKTTTMTYDAAKGTYKAAQYGSDWMDAGANKALEFKNLVVLYTSHWFVNDGTYNRSYYDLVGSGEGVLVIDGQMVPIQWHRQNPTDPFTYTLKDGKPVTLGVGKTYVGITSAKSPVTAE